MKALSIRQPWAWLILRPDITDPAERTRALEHGHIKDIENRDWYTRFHGRLLIHASKGMTRDEYMNGWDTLDEIVPGATLPPFKALERGGIVGSAEMIGCVRASTSRWFFGEYGFVFRDPRPLPFVPYRGSLGFFDVPAEVLTQDAR